MIDRWLIARGPRTYLRLALPAFGRVVIGAAPECDARIGDEELAAEHLILYLDDELGLEARAPLIAKEQPIAAGRRIALAPGDRLRIGMVTIELGRGEEASAADHHLRGAGAMIMIDPSMRRVEEQLALAAAVDTPVLILGETGTGKSLAAETIHRRSARARAPFRIVAGTDAAALEAIAAEARGGTIVVDELGGLDTRTQLAWRHLIERPPEGVRLIFISNHRLSKEVEDGSLRKDLYFWLQRLVIELPPLNARPGDIIPLAEHFLAKIGDTLVLTEAAKQKLIGYTWPGNVRELMHALERAVLSAKGDAIDAADLPGSEASNLRDEVAEFERRRITAALDAHATRAEAAKALGIPLRTLAYRMEVLGISGAK